jgi:hypothetical protein
VRGSLKTQHNDATVKERLPALVRDLFTCLSKVIKKFHNSINEHLNVQTKKEKKEEENRTPMGFDPGTSGSKTHRLSTCAMRIGLKTMTTTFLYSDLHYKSLT